jgi:hypothetical protein
VAVAKAVTLSNGRSWSTQTAAQEHFRAILHRYADNQVIENRQDHEDLVALLQRYDMTITDGPPKIGAGIDHFERRRNVGEGWSTPGFWVIRTTGDATDFSYPSAVKGRPMSDEQQFYGACRTAVQPDLVLAKRKFFDMHGDAQGRVACEVTGQLVPFEEAHLDHEWPPFVQIVAGFLAARGWSHSVPAGVVTAPGDAQTVSAFADKNIADTFIRYHHALAQMRMVSDKANLAMAAGQRRPKILRPVVLSRGTV